MDYKTIIVGKEAEKGVGYITLNRPEKLNAINLTMRRELGEAANAFADDDDVKSIVIKGDGRAFCAGYDMSGQEKSKRDSSAVGWMMRSSGIDDVFVSALWDNPKVIIGQVHSFALAGASRMLCHMDMVFCTKDSFFGYPPVRYASSGADMVWPVIVGLRKCMYLMSTGNMMQADEAYRVGMVNEVFATKEELETAVQKLVKTINKIPLAGIWANKRCVHEWYECMGIRTALRYTQQSRSVLYGTSPESLPHGIQDINRVTAEKGMKAGFEYMNQGFSEEDAIAASSMVRPDRKA